MSDNDNLLKSVGNFLEVEIRGYCCYCCCCFSCKLRHQIWFIISQYLEWGIIQTQMTQHFPRIPCVSTLSSQLLSHTPTPPQPHTPTPDISGKLMTKVLRIGWQVGMAHWKWGNRVPHNRLTLPREALHRHGEDQGNIAPSINSHCGVKNWTVVTGLGRPWGQMNLFGFRLCSMAVAASEWLNSHVLSGIAHIFCSCSLCDSHSL